MVHAESRTVPNFPVLAYGPLLWYQLGYLILTPRISQNHSINHLIYLSVSKIRKVYEKIQVKRYSQRVKKITEIMECVAVDLTLP